MTDDLRLFLPVRILKKQWAEKFLEGSIRMLSLNDYGIWNEDTKGQTKEKNNLYRHDLNEGTIRNINPKTGDFFPIVFSPEEKNGIQNFWYIDEDLRYFKIYCMYCFTYNTNKKEFERPDKKLIEFGDTAVIIYDLKEFMYRIAKSLFDRFGDNANMEIKEVQYYDIIKDFGNFDIFCKEKRYGWQNEIRIAIGLTDNNEIIIDEKGRQLKALIRDISPLTIEIGSIKDIAISISTEDLIDLKLPSGFVLPDNCFANTLFSKTSSH